MDFTVLTEEVYERILAMETQSDKAGMAIQELLDRIENDFTYHAPKPGQAELYNTLRQKEKELAKFIVCNTPVSREQSLAITALEQCMYHANAAVARHG